MREGLEYLPEVQLIQQVYFGIEQAEPPHQEQGLGLSDQMYGEYRGYSSRIGIFERIAGGKE